MRDGLYVVAFRTPLGQGSGVVHLLQGKVVGGDSSYYYFGTYSITGDKFSAVVKTARHSPGLVGVFGKDNVTINLKGTVAGDAAQVQGSSPDAPNMTFGASLRRLAD